MKPEMGGATDLVSSARRVLVAMQYTVKGQPRIVKWLRTSHFGASVGTGVAVQQVLAATEAELVVPKKVSPMPIELAGSRL